MSVQDDHAKAAERNDGALTMLRELLPQLLTAIAGALGIVGFVALVGGAITWNRFNAVELPADQAVAAFSESRFVAVGVGSLIVFLLIGAGAVVIIRQIEKRGPYERRWGLLTLVTGGMLYAIWLVPDQAQGGQLGVHPREKIAITVLILLAWVLAFVLLGWRKPEQAQTLARLTFGRPPPKTARMEEKAWPRRPLRTVARLRPKRDTGGWFRHALTPDPPVACARLMMIIFGAELLFAWLLWVLYDPWLGVTLLIGGVLGAICVLIGDRSDQSGFADYGLAIFASVVIFGGATEAMKARYLPEVQPAALIRTGEERGSGICGLYVTENDDRVYLARLRPNPRDASLPARNSGRIFFVDKERVSALSIGPLMGIGAAAKRARELRAELVVDAQPPGPREETVTITRTFERNGVQIERTYTRVIPAASAASPSEPQTIVPPLAAAQPTEDRELAARRAEAELSCAPPPVGTE